MEESAGTVKSAARRAQGVANDPLVQAVQNVQVVQNERRQENLCELCSTIVEIFRSLRKFCKSQKLSDSDIPRAKSPRRQVFESVFGFLLSAFASLREIFRFLLVAP
jgi:hypothetical protein